MGLFDGPLFDLNGDGRMDMLEFLAVTQNDPTNPMNESDSFDIDEFDDEPDYDEEPDFDDYDFSDEY